MSFKPHLFWIPFALAGLFLAGCNFPTPTAEAPTESIGATLVEPSPASSEVPASPASTSPATAQAAVATSTPGVQNLRIAYTSDGNLWALEIGSEPMQLTDDGSINDVRISDDGEWIAYVVRDPDQDSAVLHSIQFDGSSPLVLLDAASFDALYPLGQFIHYTLSNLEFLPGTHTLLFNTRGVFEGPGLAKNDDLLSIDVTTGQISPLLARGEGGDFTVSPTGDQIAIVRADSLSLVNADGAGLRPEVLTFTPVITYSEYFFYPLPVWAGTEVVLAVPQQDPFFAAEPGTVWSVNGEPQLLSRPEGDLFGPQREFPIVSPDGASVAYFRASDDASEMHLVIEQLDTGEQTIYDTGPIQWKGWGPESNRVVYTKGTGFDLYLGEIGAPPAPLAPGTGLRWINANEYLYVAGDPGGWTLMLADLEGGSMPLAMLSGTFVTYDFAE
jgi:Tol biopolymer transport system component